VGNLSTHFDSSEFRCKCGTCDEVDIAPELITFLEEVRSVFDVPVTITSGHRCEFHNANVGGGAASQHILGNAADFIVKDVPPSIVADLAEERDVPGVGRYSGWTHADVRSGPLARWGSN
jgi:uncharacterized protein YcbK (DUF882 family)